jgi:lysophospholipase L1-like esterase
MMREGWILSLLSLTLGSGACSMDGGSDTTSAAATGTATSTGGSTTASGGAGVSSATGMGGRGSGGSPSAGGAGGTAGSSGAAASGTGGTGGSSGAGGSGDSGSSGAAGAGGDREGGTDGGRSSDASHDGSLVDAGLYSPCPPRGQPCVILPVGDSITAGVGSSTGGSYRVPLFHLANTEMKSITFVGANTGGPSMVDGKAFPRANSGYSGYNIDNAAGRMGISPFFPAQITTYKPHIVLLMIGTNDVNTGETDIPTRLGMLMDTILNADPSLLLVVAQIVPQRKAIPDTMNMRVQAYNAAIPGLVKTRADAGKHVATVDMFGAFTADANYSTTLLSDGLHPNDAGYQVMANTWYAEIGPLLR